MPVSWSCPDCASTEREVHTVCTGCKREVNIRVAGGGSFDEGVAAGIETAARIIEQSVGPIQHPDVKSLGLGIAEELRKLVKL